MQTRVLEKFSIEFENSKYKFLSQIKLLLCTPIYRRFSKIEIRMKRNLENLKVVKNSQARSNDIVPRANDKLCRAKYQKTMDLVQMTSNLV